MAVLTVRLGIAILDIIITVRAKSSLFSIFQRMRRGKILTNQHHPLWYLHQTNLQLWSVKSILSVCTLLIKDEESLTYQETNVLAYIAGYIVHKIEGKVCSSCTEKLLGIADTNNPSHDLIEMKSYGGLIIPSQLLLGTVELLELEDRNSIES